MTDTMPHGEARISMRSLVGWGVIGQMSYVASQFILLLALARFATVAEVGHFGFANAIITPIFFFFNLGLRVNQATDIGRQFNFNEFLFLRAACTTIAYLLILVIAFAVLDPQTRFVALVFGAAKAAETFSDLFYGFFQRGERLQYVARSLALRGLGSAVLFTIILASSGSIATAFFANLGVWLLVAVFVDYLPARRLAVRDGDIGTVRLRSVVALAWSSLPLGMNALFSALQGNLPRYITGWLLGLVALGQFTIVGYAMQAIMTVTMAISQSISSRLAFYVSIGNRKAFFNTFRKFVLLIAVAGGSGAVASLVIGDWLIRTVFGPDYAGLGMLFAICILSAALRAAVIILQSGLFASRHFRLSMVLRAFSLALMFVFCLAGAWWGGLIGLAWAMALTFLLHSIALWVSLKRMAFPAPEPAAGLHDAD
jgi:O-antigen/teichoic acid export membrane protein